MLQEQSHVQMSQDLMSSVLRAAAEVCKIVPHDYSKNTPSTAISVHVGKEGGYEILVDRIHWGLSKLTPAATGQSELIFIYGFDDAARLTHVAFREVDGSLGNTSGGEKDLDAPTIRASEERTARQYLLILYNNPLVKQKLEAI